MRPEDGRECPPLNPPTGTNDGWMSGRVEIWTNRREYHIANRKLYMNTEVESRE